MSYREIKVFGPPGTGKTTWACRQIERAQVELGVERVLVTSFTKTAAIEIGRRAKLPSREACATLHSHAYRAIGGGKIAETMADEFNAYCEARGLLSYKLTGKVDTEVDMYEPGAATQPDSGDALYLASCHLRARMVPPEQWPDYMTRQWFATWQAWKATCDDVVDFTDMIELAIERKASLPRRCDIIFADEAQDFTLLELTLLRQWGRMAGQLVLLGDDEQCIYAFKGAEPSSFLTSPPDADVTKITLKQSYRLPRRVHSYAARWAAGLSLREPKQYEPRPEEGEAVAVDCSRVQVEHVIELVKRHEATGSVMLLASCSYMLTPWLQALRAAGIPYHNPYRIQQGAWNPLATRANALTAANRIAVFLMPSPDWYGEAAHPWTLQELAAWTEHVRKQKSRDDDEGVLLYRKRAALEDAAKARPNETAVLSDWLTPWACEDCQYLEADWLASAIKPDEKARYDYPLTIFRNRGLDGLVEHPRVIVGTIHSVKGGEADTVIVSPDLSNKSATQGMVKTEDRDAVYRMMYVAVTRARVRLVMLKPSSADCVRCPT